jgi:hypothetical protein
MTHKCYLCESPIEKADNSELGVFVACCESDEHHILCSMCTNVVQEAKKQLRHAGKVLVVKTIEGVVAVADPASYRFR